MPEGERILAGCAAIKLASMGTCALSFSFAHSGAGWLEEAIMCLTPGGTGFAVPSTSWWRSIWTHSCGSECPSHHLWNGRGTDDSVLHPLYFLWDWFHENMFISMKLTFVSPEKKAPHHAFIHSFSKYVLFWVLGFQAQVWSSHSSWWRIRN